jgi:LysM domain
VFHDGPGAHRSVIRHEPGHVAHVHVRFVSAASRQRGHELYDRLVREGYVQPGRAGLEHRVRRGDTLGGIARRYHASVRDIQAINHLRGTLIQVGRRLTISVAVPLRGVRDPIRRPARRPPPSAAP